MINQLARFVDLRTMIWCVVISTAVLVIAFLADRLCARRVLTADAIWRAALAFLLFVPAALLVVPHELAATLASFIHFDSATSSRAVSEGAYQAPFVKGPSSSFAAPETFPFSSSPHSSAATVDLPIPPGRLGVGILLASIAAAGSGLLLLRLLASRKHCRALIRNSLLCREAVWLQSLERCCTKLDIRRPIALRHSNLISSPLTLGYLHPVILLPKVVEETAGREMREAILTHETTHVARGDYLIHLGWSVCKCLYWWNPLIWLATRRVAMLREIVCDGFCVTVLNNREGYIQALLEIGKRIVNSRNSAIVVTMAGTTDLAARLRGIESHHVQSHLARRSIRRGFSLVAVLCVMIVGIATAAQQSPSAQAASASAKSDAKSIRKSKDSYGAATSAAHPTPAQKDIAQQGNKKSQQLCAELSKDPQFQLAAGETLRFLPKGTRSDPLEQLRQLYSDGDRKAWISFQAPGPGEGVQAASWTYDDDRTIIDHLTSVLGVAIHQLTFDETVDREKFLNTIMLGDWLFRDSPQLKRPLDQRELDVVAEAISKRLERKCELRISQKYLPVYVATGDYKYKADPAGQAKAVSANVAAVAEGEFWVPARRRKHTGSVVQTFDTFLSVWGEVLLTPIVDQVGRRPINDDFFLRLSSDALVPLVQPLTPEQHAKVVQSFCDQTGLELKESRRQVPVVRVILRDMK